MRWVKLSLFCKVFLLIFLFFQWSPVEAAKRVTRTLTLENGLSVFLVHDPDVHRSAAALSVGTGSIFDPEDKLGLAHYLEHMLFLGTQKYPEVGSFKKYLNANSGASNAYTAKSITNYFFQVSHEAFEGALDRFSDFFKAPLFDEHYAEREVNAVSSEHDKNVMSDGWRNNYIIDLISEPGHPLRKFGTGNKETLAGDNRPALLDFYEKYYSASNMKLAVLSKLSLREQTALVKKLFLPIKNRPVVLPKIDPEYRKPLQGKFRLLKIKTIKDTRSLQLSFPTIRLKDHLDSKPASLVAYIIGYEGKGSLLSQLKAEGLALGLSAGGSFSHPAINSFRISISLTPRGVKHYQRALDLVFAYVNMLRKHGIEKYTFEERQTMAQIDFDWKDPDEGMGYVASMAGLMQDYPLEKVETEPFLYEKFDPQAYRGVLESLVPQNMLAVLSTNSVATDSRDKFYGAEYSSTAVDGEAFRRLTHPPAVPTMFYPEKNNFIPYNLALVEENPHLVRDDDLAKVWFKFDHRFKQPKVFIKFRIETPKVYNTVDNYARAKLYDASIHEGLNEMVYPIQLAGFSYSLDLEKKGVVLTVGGYSTRVSDLLRLVARNLIEIKIDAEKFKNIKEAIIRGLKNRKLGMAFHRGGYFNRLLLLAKDYNEEQVISALQPVTLEDVKAYARTLYEKVYITGLAYGNWNDKEVESGIRVLLEEIPGRPLPENERYQEVVEILGPGENAVFSRKVKDTNNSIIYTLQIGEFDLAKQARTSMIASIVESDFYTQMRTNQQLGYIVGSFHRRIEDRLFFNFVIQSATHPSFDLLNRLKGWLADSGKLFDNLSDQEFERHRKGLIVSLEKEPDSMAGVTGDLYYLATREKGNFQFKEQLIEVVKKLTKEEVVAAAKTLLQDMVTPRLAVLMRAAGNNEPVPDGVLSEVTQFKNRDKSSASLWQKRSAIN
ncbi:MAG: insulinase family protein [Nitrospinales bacterium]